MIRWGVTWLGTKGSGSFIEHKQTSQWAREQRTKLNLGVYKKFTELQSAKQKYKEFSFSALREIIEAIKIPALADEAVGVWSRANQ